MRLKIKLKCEYNCKIPVNYNYYIAGYKALTPNIPLKIKFTFTEYPKEKYNRIFRIK